MKQVYNINIKYINKTKKFIATGETEEEAIEKVKKFAKDDDIVKIVVTKNKLN
jgi:hypothetical protein